MVILPLVDNFTNPYKVWSKRDATREEQDAHYRATGKFLLHGVNDQLLLEISSSFQAACFMAQQGADGGLADHINHELDKSTGYKAWRNSMPSATPKSLSDYQQKYPYCDFDAINAEINNIGASLLPGQFLFHGGCWPVGLNTFTTTRPLSTTFCPQVALREVDYRRKAFEAGYIDLFVLRIVSSTTNVFAYRRKGTRLGHENEVLFAAGATLTLRSRKLIRNDYKAIMIDDGFREHSKFIPINVLEINIS